MWLSVDTQGVTSSFLRFVGPFFLVFLGAREEDRAYVCVFLRLSELNI